jgi:superfamily I DNA/RNA helicase
MENLMKMVVEEKKQDREIFVKQLVAENKNLPRPLGNLDITVCNILGSKGLGADVVFLIGFDQGKLPSKSEITDSEIYQMLVALTRAKKRIYLVNTIGRPVSKFINYIDKKFVKIL